MKKIGRKREKSKTELMTVIWLRTSQPDPPHDNHWCSGDTKLTKTLQPTARLYTAQYCTTFMHILTCEAHPCVCVCVCVCVLP